MPERRQQVCIARGGRGIMLRTRDKEVHSLLCVDLRDRSSNHNRGAGPGGRPVSEARRRGTRAAALVERKKRDAHHCNTDSRHRCHHVTVLAACSSKTGGKARPRVLATSNAWNALQFSALDTVGAQGLRRAMGVGKGPYHIANFGEARVGERWGDAPLRGTIGPRWSWGWGSEGPPPTADFGGCPRMFAL